MSILSKEIIEVIAQSIGINNLSPDVAQEFAPDVEYRLREIMQESTKCMRHSKRTILTTDDVNSALSLKNVEPIYGFASEDPLRFKKAVGHPDLFYIDDKDLEFKDVIEAPLPKTPLDTAVLVHWLAIEGVQPAIPENPTVGALGAPSENKKIEREKDYGLPIDVKLPVKHVLSRELQLYFEKITELILTQADLPLFNEALVSLSTDSGLHPLVPYFTQFIADEVSRSLSDLNLLFALMRVVRSLLRNPHIHVEPYLHQLMPSVVTCVVSKKLGRGFSQNHWQLRDFTADLIGFICRRFGHIYHNLQPRVTKTLLHAFLDPNRALTQHYGAVQGLAAMGSSVVRLLILPNLEPYLKLLEPEMVLENQKNEVKRYEAWRVYGALLHAGGRCMYERVKLFPGLLSSSARTTVTNATKVITTLHSDNAAKGIVSSGHTSNISRKRTAGSECPSQPASKTPATENTIAALQSDSLVDSSGAASGGQTTDTVGETAIVKATGQNSDEQIRGSRREKEMLKKSERSVSALAQAWKEDADAGQLLASLVDLFGEGMHTFIASREMSLFL